MRRGCGCFLQLLLIAGLVGAGVAGWTYWTLVVRDPGEHMAREAILRVISQESPVYYRDGKTKLGVFFDEEHRQYLPFAQFPQPFVDALVAAEDEDFWTHHGFSVRGVARAMVQNVKAGRVVAGGSTLTQQTAKNLFKRKDRSFEEKLRELLNGLRLEHHYSKEEILEFYANQFYVNGNGRGLAIAARWFFDKDVSALTLHECAFLAGVVKGPERYNPFVPGADRRERAKARSQERVGYVLDRMLELGSISEDQWSSLRGQEVPFKRGRFRYERSVVLDEVERELGRADVRAAFDAFGVVDPGREGLVVVTTIDPTIQNAALYGLRHHLTEVGTLLDGPEFDSIFLEDADARPLDSELERVHAFHAGTVVGVDPGARTVAVDLGGRTAMVDAKGNERLAQILLRAKARNLWATAKKADVSAFVERVGAYVGRAAVFSVREIDTDGVPRLDWEWSSELQGAVVVLERGDVRAMVGGTRNADFNRALAARRQFGSTWKPVLYQAALQLGWSASDRLWNEREVYPYQSTFYFPRPDHEDRDREPTMAMASARSENLASIWLLAHLLDPLDSTQIRAVAGAVGLLPGHGQSREDWIRSIQSAGVLPTEEKRESGIWDELRAGLAGALEGEGRTDEALVVRQLQWGLGFGAEEQKVAKDKGLDKKERGARRQILRRNVQRLHNLGVAYDSTIEGFRQAEAEARPLASTDFGGFQLHEDGRVLFDDAPIDGARPMTPEDLAVPLPGEDPAAIVESVVVRLGPTKTWLQGQITVETLARIEGAVAERRAAAGPDLWAWDELLRIRDFRHLLSLRYVQKLAMESGVRSPIQPVLSLPLGSSDLSLVEVALLYQGLWTNEVYTPYADPMIQPAKGTVEVDQQLLDVEAQEHPPFRLIQEIRLADGTVIYRSAMDRARLQPEEVGIQGAALLRAVVTHGTGSKAEGAVRPRAKDPARQQLWDESGLWVPLFGKTGTTNGYRNAAFVGFVPGVDPQSAALKLGEGAVIAVYVGYDDNREMRRGGIRMMGASASLPIWLATAQGTADALEIGERLDPADAALVAKAPLPIAGWAPSQRPELGPQAPAGIEALPSAEPTPTDATPADGASAATTSASEAGDPSAGAQPASDAAHAMPTGPFLPSVAPVFAPVGVERVHAPPVPFPELGPAMPPPPPDAETVEPAEEEPSFGPDGAPLPTDALVPASDDAGEFGAPAEGAPRRGDDGTPSDDPPQVTPGE